MSEYHWYRDTWVEQMSKCKETIELARMLYPFINEGRERAVFDMGDGYVLKVPKNTDGMLANEREYKLYNNHKDWDAPKFAYCELITIGEISCCLKMEKVRPLLDEKKPDWASYIDCQQVGIDKNNTVVAYDYADY